MRNVRLDVLVAAIALAGLAGIAYWTYAGWPHLPLDLSPKDARVTAALARAREEHLATAAFAATVPIALLVLASLLRKKV